MRISFGKIYSMPCKNNGSHKMEMLEEELKNSGQIEKKGRTPKVKLVGSKLKTPQAKYILYVNDDGYDRYIKEVYNARSIQEAKEAKTQHLKEAIPITMGTTVEDILKKEQE